MRRKITLIGAGSVVFAKKLIGDILQFPELADSEICLMDLNPQRLKAAKIMTQKMVEVLAVDARVTATTDRTDAIRGAHYVVCTIQVGGYRPSTVVDFEIPAKYGLQQTIGDTLGVGGVFRGLRTIPHILDISKDIATVAQPGCLLLNYSNPMAMNCWALDRATGIPHVGLCHSVQHTSQALASYTGLNSDDVTYKVAGINHMAFFLEFNYKGQDAYPLLFKALDDPSAVIQDKVRFEMMRRLGYFVTESSEHQSEYVPYFIHHGDKVIDEFLIPIDEYLRRCEAIIATWQQEEKELLGEVEGKSFEVAPQSQEYGSYIIHAKEANAPIVIYGNVPNRNLISNLPDGCCVEVPIVVDANGLQPTQIGKLPPQLAAICRTNVNVQDLTVEAALTKQREYIYQAVMMDPHTSTTLTLDKIWAMCDEMIEAHQKDGYMGEFAPVIKNTGRAYKGTGDRAIARLKTQGTFSFEAGSTNELQLQIDNPGNEPICTAIGFTSSVEGVRINAMEINVSANSNQSFPVLVSLQTAVKQPIDIDLKTDGSEVLLKGLSLSPRKILEKDSAGLSRFELHMRGEVAASGSISRDEDNLHLDITVNDSDIHPAQSSVIGIMAGSAIELRIATSEHTEVTTINIIPGKKGDESSVAFHNTLNKEINVGCIQQTTTPLSYRIAADIPLTETGLDPNASEALIEIRTLLSALGEAHSGGATCLTEQPGRKSTLPYFHKILF
ncbi:alpha-glucosidase/alpha-galactosidase [Opitutales bacterium]|nr:alpha-glucosidase/alpha-galactosidase [Opitutales bacterium]